MAMEKQASKQLYILTPQENLCKTNDIFQI